MGYAQQRRKIAMARKRKSPVRAQGTAAMRRRDRRAPPPAAPAPEGRKATDLRIRELMELFGFTAAAGKQTGQETNPDALSSVGTERKVHDLPVGEFLRILVIR
jgi:hypothetical protein